MAWGCGESTQNKQGEVEHMEAHHGDGPEYNSAYVCPMHCEGSGSDSPGECPVCGMAYVENSEHTSDGHDHSGGGHEGHNH